MDAIHIYGVSLSLFLCCGIYLNAESFDGPHPASTCRSISGCGVCVRLEFSQGSIGIVLEQALLQQRLTLTYPCVSPLFSIKLSQLSFH